MKNWFDITRPHEDIRKGDFDESVFAADLGDVAQGRAAQDYGDPYTFFRKTYLTRGLAGLLEDVHRKLNDGKGPAVVELQIPFGGGKTHALVTVYHYLTNGERMKEFLPEAVGPVSAAVCALVGTQLNAAKGRESDGVRRHTLWGELAFQVGGGEAYRRIEANDRDRVSPGKEDLRALLEPHQPFVLLFDEILEYVVKARGVAVREESLGAQTLSFFNELTEAVASLSKGMMIVTLPSSELEDFGDQEQRNLAQLEKIFGRLESIVAPVADEEISSIVRRRLFEPVEDEGQVRAVVDGYFRKYQEHREELPGKVREGAYREQMERAYPFHPDVINLLYEKWGTFSSFQRTRGALRFLANVLEALYEEETNLDVILPGDISLERTEIRRELLRHIGPEYDGIIAADIAGPDAKSQVMDRQNRPWKHLAERIGTGVFLHSFTAGEADAGATLPEIKLAVLRPDDHPALVTEVLHKQSAELWYLNQRGERHYFSSVPNLNRMVLDKKELVPEAQVREEIKRRVQQQLGSKLRGYLWPASSEALPDNRDLKLAVLDPTDAPSLSDLAHWVTRRGEGLRVYRNTLVFALPDGGRFAKLENDVRELLALQEIAEEIGEDERPGMGERRAEVKRRIRDLDEAIPYRVRELYRTVAVPRADGELESIDLGQPSIAQDSLDGWYRHELIDPSHQKILDRPPSSAMLAAKALGDGKPVSLHDLLEQFYKDPGLPVPVDDGIVAEALARGVEEGAFGVGAGSAGEIKAETVKFEEALAASWVEFREDVFLVPPDQAGRLKAQVEGQDEQQPGEEGGTGPEPTPGGGADDTGEGTQGPTGEESGKEEDVVPRVRFRASGLRASRIADVHSGVLKPLVGQVGDFEFTLEIDVGSAEGISKRVLEQQVMETLRQLGSRVEELGAEDGPDGETADESAMDSG